MILDVVLQELFGFGEKKKPEAYKGDIGKHYPGTEKEYERAKKVFIDSKKGVHHYPDEYNMIDFYVFDYNEELCKKIAKSNMISSKDIVEDLLIDDGEKEIIKAQEFFKKNKVGELIYDNGDGYVYSPGTNRWYDRCHELTPQVNPNKPLSFSYIINHAKKLYEEEIKDYSI